MECNKEEAIRAKEIAETKLQNKDFLGARKIALKAQQLYPELENITRLLTVCDVHLSAENMGPGNEKNYYDILKTDSMADEISIKKQYKKFALLLHPDKNNFVGATDAFKLIGEAQRVLLDRENRRVHDAKLKIWKANGAQPQQQASNNPNIRSQTWAQNPFSGKTTSPFTSFNPKQQQPQKPPQSTFWTMCPHCMVKYQYYRDVIGKTLLCQGCKNNFTGLETKNHTAMNQTTWDYKPKNYGQNAGPQKNASVQPQVKESVAKSGTSEVRKDFKTESKPTAKVKCKKKRRIDESSESSDSDSSSESDENVIEENGDVKVTKDFGVAGENLRRSTRLKTNISYKENLSDDDLGSSSKKSKSGGSFGANADQGLEKQAHKTNKFEGSSKPMEEENLDNLKPKEARKGTNGPSVLNNGAKVSVEATGEISSDSSSDGPTVPEIYDYPDPDFNDFDKFRSEDCFAGGQIWAAYDTLDGMPRFYARIDRKISTSKMKITWLEPNPVDEEENKWVDAGLPASCGILRKGNTETSDSRLMFSHQPDWEKGSKRDTFKIYPRKGDIWALFKNWNMNWHSNPEFKKKFEYEFVEILSDHSGDTGVFVAYLAKVKGFSCVFCRTSNEAKSFQIPRSELFRFSHMVPSFRLSGEEREDVPKGSFELDPAALPPKLEESDIPEDPKVEVETVVLSDEDSPVCETKDKMELDLEGNSSSGEESPEVYEMPEPEFFNFDNEKSPEKFQPGQFWALYSDEDGLPKYYAFVNKINHQPKFELLVTWLTACPTRNMLKFADKRMPIGCGMFKHYKGEPSSYTSTATFSHCLTVDPTDKMDEFGIFPKKGEVWAVYKNWKSKMTRSDLKNCEYDIVEILEENDFSIKGVALEKVSGYNSVFKVQKNNGSLVTVEVDRPYLLKFSHKIPTFRLTSERGGSLKGYWELDPAALPVTMFISS